MLNKINLLVVLLFLLGCSEKTEPHIIDYDSCKKIGILLDANSINYNENKKQVPCKIQINDNIYGFYTNSEVNAIKFTLSMIINRDKIAAVNRCFKITIKDTMSFEQKVLVDIECKKLYEYVDYYDLNDITIRSFRKVK